MSDIHTDAYRAHIVQEFADRRHEIERVTLWTSDSPRKRAMVDNYGAVPYRTLDITPMVATS